MGSTARSTLHAAEVALEEAIRLQKLAEQKCYQNMAEVAHDIKNPLTAMMGHIAILRNEIAGPLGDKTYGTCVHALDSSSRRLLGICESLLGDDGEKAENEHPVTNINALSDEIIELFSVQAQERGIQLDAEIPEAFPAVSADPDEMFRVLSNLVSNAMKFTPRGGKVQLLAEVDENDNAFVMVVRDSGVGMTREQIREVLMEDSHASTLSPHGDIGSGYGLGIVNRIVREMGGRLDIVSSENRGTRVRIKFPSSLLLDPPAKAADAGEA